MSPQDIFPSDDITLISTVDSADFARFGLRTSRYNELYF